MFTFLRLNKEIDIEGLYTFYYYEHSKNFRYIGEKHDFWELVYVDSGEIYAVAESNGYVLSQGNVIFHKPMEFHGMAAVNSKPHNVLVVTFETKSPAMNYFSNKIFMINSKQKKLLSQLLTEIKNSLGTILDAEDTTKIKFNNEQRIAYQIAIQHLEHFLLELMRENTLLKRNDKLSSLAKKNIENALVDSIKNYLQANIYNTITLADVCGKFLMSKSYISQLFKNETGSSVIDYYISLKIQEAKILMREGNLNFTQISDKLGYKSLHHFTRIFKTKEKMSPSAYVKSIK